MRLVFEIGDWVSVGGQPVQVYAVHKNKIAYHVGNDKTKTVKWAFINTVALLIIAPYMFDGNGFKCVMGHDVTFGGNLLGVCPDKYIYKDDDCYVTVARFEDGWNITHVRYDGAQPTNSAMVKYAHELQHALRLFGIKKEIRL